MLVVGATGNVGRRVVDGLVAERVRVRALVRDPGRAAFAPEVETARGNLTDPTALSLALQDVETVFLIWPFHEAEGADAVLEVLADQPRRVVYLSSSTVKDLGPQSDRIPEMHAELESTIADSGLSWTALRADTLSSNALGWAAQIRETGVVRALEVAPTAVVHEGDVAAVAVRLLIDPAPTGSRHVVTGPRVVSRADQLQAIAAALGRPLRFEALTLADARAAMTTGGVPSPLRESLLSMAEFRPRSDLVTTTVEDFTGRPARDIREWTIEHQEDFR